MWSQATRSLWQHGPLVMMLCATLLLMAWARRRPWVIQFAGATLAFAFICRPTSAIPILAITCYVLIRYRTWAPQFFAWAVILAAPWLAYNWSITNTLFTDYYLPSRIEETSTFWTALTGNLVSPGRGLLVYSPVLICAVPGFWFAMRRPEHRALALISGGVVIIHTIMIARFPHWWGGWSYGTRFMTDVMPFLVYLVAIFIDDISRWAPRPRASAALGLGSLITISLFMHGQGALNYATLDWSSTPANIDLAPDRLWDWRDPAFLRGLSPSARSVAEKP